MNEQAAVSEKSDTAWAQKGLAIASLVLAFALPLVGIVGSIVSLLWAKRTGASTRIPMWGIIVGVIMFIVGIVLGIIAFILLTNAVNAGALNVEALCENRGSWAWLLDSLRYVCR